MKRTATLLLLAIGLVSASYLARLDVGPAERAQVVAEALPVYKDLGTCLVLPLAEARLTVLRDRGWYVEVLDTDLAPGDYFIIYKAGRGAGEVPGRVLWETERLRLVRLPELDARAAKAAGFPIVQLPLSAHPLPVAATPTPDPRPLTPDTTVARLVSLVSLDSLARTIKDLQAFGTRYSYYPKCESAAFYLRQRLVDLGYVVRLDTYYLRTPTTRAFNVEATLAGVVAPETVLVAGSHFDTYNEANQNIAPGADDNGTGTAAVIELARVLKQAQFRWSVKFLSFSGEEQWMKGSYHWVDSTARPQNLKIAGVYNLDMFGYAAFDTNLVFVNTNTASRPLADLCDSTNAWYSLGLRVMNYLDEDIYGDNTPFWEAGYAGVFALEDSEWGIWNGSNPNYHTPGDTFGILTMSLVSRATAMTAACLATLATPYHATGAEETPSAKRRTPNDRPTIVRGVLFLPEANGEGRQATGVLVDALGRRALELNPGPNDVSHLATGVYFVHSTLDNRRSSITRVILTE